MNKSANSDNGIHKMNGIKKKSLNVSIIGGGLVGSLAALYLARRGFHVDLFEYREDIRTAELVVGRSINLALSARGRKALAEVGLEKELLDHGIPMRGRMLHDLKGNYTIVPYDRNTNQCIYSVGRKHLNEILLNAAENYTNIELNFNYKLVSSQFDDGILNFVKTSGEEIQIKTDLIVGCDGAFSVVRRGMLSKPGFDFEQKYIEHGYIELCIPPTKDNDFAMPKNYLHIWPRGKFMMIALPNQDKTWTVTLFMPFKNFDDIRTIDQLVDFFKMFFPDAIALIGREKLIKDFFNIKPQALISVKCRSYHHDSKVLLLGDAAHAVVPFYGQGMNAGFEDCTVLNDLLSKYSNNIETTLEAFSESRWKDLHAISDLAMYNYVEMRDLVNRKTYRIRKHFDDFLYRLFPTKWIPLYNSVSFSHMPYKQCVENRKWQDKLITNLFYFIGVIVPGLFLLVIMNV